LLPVFARKRLDEITVADVDAYRLRKVREGRLGPVSINKTLATLAAILDVAVEYDHIARNPAAGKRRRLPTPAPKRTWLDRAAHVAALLDGARELDGEARALRGQRRALVATLVFAGLRISEALDLRWGDVDLARGAIRVGRAKTVAGERTVYVLPVLRDELVAYRAIARRAERTDRVFATGTGGRWSETNVRRRVLKKAVEKANVRLERDREDPITAGLTPHSLRRTFASLLVATGEDAVYIAGQLGHVDASCTLNVYAYEMRRRDGERERLRALVEGADWAAVRAPVGTSARESSASAADRLPA
jgi:integrase